MFQFPRLPLSHTRVRVPTHDGGGLPHSEICGSACKRLPAAFRSVTTSFFGPACLGIHHLPLIACMAFPFSRLPPPLTVLPSSQGGQGGRTKRLGREVLSYQARSYSAFMVTHFTSLDRFDRFGTLRYLCEIGFPFTCMSLFTQQ